MNGSVNVDRYEGASSPAEMDRPGAPEIADYCGIIGGLAETFSVNGSVTLGAAKTVSDAQRSFCPSLTHYGMVLVLSSALTCSWDNSH